MLPSNKKSVKFSPINEQCLFWKCQSPKKISSQTRSVVKMKS